MAESLTSSTPEQTTQPEYTSEWDALTNPNESWEEHLANAQRYKEDTSLIDSIDAQRRKSEGEIRDQRAQELFERQLNAKMDTTIEDLENLGDTPNSGVIKTEIFSENGTKLELINLDGYPFKFIQHAIDYKSSSPTQHDTLGNETSTRLKEDPSIWDVGRDKVDFSATDSDAKGNVISASYVNLGNDTSYKKRIDSSCAYGWTTFKPMSVIAAGWTDIHSANSYSDRATIGEYSLPLIDDLDQPSEDMHLGPYNEIVMRRYDEAGRPRRPDFVIADDKHNLDLAKKHAEYFGVPIIRISDKYAALALEHELTGKEQAGTLTPEDSANLDLIRYIGNPDIQDRQGTAEAINVIKGSISKRISEMNEDERQSVMQILSAKAQYLQRKYRGMGIDLGDLSEKIKIKTDLPFTDALKDMEAQAEAIGRL